MSHRRQFMQAAVATSVAGAGNSWQLAGSAWAAPAVERWRAKVVRLEALTHNVRRVSLLPLDTEFTFAAGQYVLLRAPAGYLTDFNARYQTKHKQVARPYSFASMPAAGSGFDLIIKHYPAPPDREDQVPPGVLSTYVHKHLKVGDTVQLGKPRGKLYSPTEPDRPVVMVAGGVGAAPFVGLLSHLFREGVDKEREIYFFLGVRSRKDLLLHEQFGQWAKTKPAFHYIPALSHPEPTDNWNGRKGYINVVLEKHFKDQLDAEVYLAGSPVMVKFTRQVLDKLGVEKARVHKDPIRVQ